jgi:DmsE family decaheme c-type cytochrome
MADGQASMNIKKSAARVLLMLAALTVSGLAAAQGSVSGSASAPSAAPAASAAAPAAAGQGTEYSDEGADTCLGCHDEDSATYSVKAIFKGRHGHRADARAPFGPNGLQCEACHGPGARHAAKGSKKKLTINTFKPDSFLTVEQRNQACLSCHDGQSRTAWHAGAHDRSKLACTDCHKIHAERDAVLAKTSQPEVCYTCHAKQRADFQQPSSHPVRYGRMGCSDCHNVHGSPAAAMLTKATLNQTCFTCHAEKRGPLLWEHAPVAEDCSLCHTAHGSVRSALLNKSPPLLCQQCHTTAGHPAVARTGAALPGGTAGGSVFLLAGSCTNCHSQVHGSNHPSGAKLMR